MDSKDRQVEEVFDSLHHLPKVATPDHLYSRIEASMDEGIVSHIYSQKYWQYAAAILIALNTLAYLFFSPLDNDSIEVSSQYDDYIEYYNWSQNDYYEYLTLSE